MLMTIFLNFLISKICLMNAFDRSVVNGCLSTIVKMNVNTLFLYKFHRIKQNGMVRNLVEWYTAGVWHRL